MAELAPQVPWPELLERLDWRQGEHVSLVGPTGAGKTTLTLEILERRANVVVFANKPRDSSMDRLVRRPGWTKMARFEPKPGQRRIVLWPKGKGLDDYLVVQRAAYKEALERIWADGHWCVAFDEVRYLCDDLGLKQYAETYWQQARALRISVVAATQRPVSVPVVMWDQATHLFMWRDNDDRNLKVIGGLGAIDAKAVRTYVSALAPREILYLNTRTGVLLRSTVEPSQALVGGSS